MFSPNIIGMIKLRRIRWARQAAHMGGKRTAYRVLVGKLEGNRSKCRWENNIKMDLRERMGVVWAGFIWLKIGTSGRFL